jgi:hypothetical protein
MGDNKNTVDIVTTSHSESFRGELEEKAAFCNAVCVNTFLSRTDFFVLIRWAVGGALVILVPVVVIYAGFLWHQGTLITQNTDNIRQMQTSYQATLNAVNSNSDKLDKIYQRVSLYPRRTP